MREDQNSVQYFEPPNGQKYHAHPQRQINFFIQDQFLF